MAIQPTKEVYFSPPEQEWINRLHEMGGNYFDCVEYVIQYKREMAIHHKSQGNHQLFKQLLQELGEWSDHLEEYDQTLSSSKKIFLPP